MPAMIEHRPKRLEHYRERITVPPKPFRVSWDWVPPLVRASLMPLTGIQPVTGAMFSAAGGPLQAVPTEGEVELFREKGIQFQMIHLVMSLAWWHDSDGITAAVPYAISALPASKRGEVQTTGIELITSLQGAPIDPSVENVYIAFDPFKGDWSLHSLGGDVIARQAGNGPLDELGLVIERFFLATKYDPDDVLEVDHFAPDEWSKRRFRQNRIKKVYKPFEKVEARRIWGLDTGIELFLFQELLFRGLRPECQYLIYPNGDTYPSLYDVYADVEFRRGANLISEVDFFFPDERLAVFCDGASHARSKQIAKDKQIVERLANVGIRSVRLPSQLIKDDLEDAGDRVVRALDGAGA